MFVCERERVTVRERAVYSQAPLHSIGKIHSIPSEVSVIVALLEFYWHYTCNPSADTARAAQHPEHWERGGEREIEGNREREHRIIPFFSDRHNNS